MTIARRSVNVDDLWNFKRISSTIGVEEAILDFKKRCEAGAAIGCTIYMLKIAHFIMTALSTKEEAARAPSLRFLAVAGEDEWIDKIESLVEEWDWDISEYKIKARAENTVREFIDEFEDRMDIEIPIEPNEATPTEIKESKRITLEMYAEKRPPKERKPPVKKEIKVEKEPWKMTRREYITSQPPSYFEQYLPPGITPEAYHEILVKQAVSNGKPVSKEVLMDYPELVTVEEKPPEKKETTTKKPARRTPTKKPPKKQRPAPKAFQVAAIKNLIARLTDIDPQTIDVEALVDPSITLEENWREIKSTMGIKSKLTEKEEEEKLCFDAINACAAGNDLESCKYACEICDDIDSCDIYRTLQEVKGKSKQERKPIEREISKLKSGIFEGKTPLRCPICYRGVHELNGAYECDMHGVLDTVLDLRKIDTDRAVRDVLREHYYSQLAEAQSEGHDTCKSYYEAYPGKDGKDTYKQFYKLGVALEEYFVKEQPLEVTGHKTKKWTPRYQKGLESGEIQTEFDAGKTRKGTPTVKAKKKVPRLGAGKEQKGFEHFGGEKVPEAGQAELNLYDQMQTEIEDELGRKKKK